MTFGFSYDYAVARKQPSGHHNSTFLKEFNLTIEYNIDAERKPWLGYDKYIT